MAGGAEIPYPMALVAVRSAFQDPGRSVPMSAAPFQVRSKWGPVAGRAFPPLTILACHRTKELLARQK